MYQHRDLFLCVVLRCFGSISLVINVVINVFQGTGKTFTLPQRIATESTCYSHFDSIKSVPLVNQLQGL